jgi:Na+/H+ antiporter NhaC
MMTGSQFGTRMMTFESTFWSLFPPLVAITLAIGTRRVMPALGAGIWMGATLVGGGNPLRGLVEAAASLLSVALEPSNTRLLIFCLLIGPLVLHVETFRGVDGFVRWLETRGLVRGARGARLLAWIVGIVVFIESNLTLLVTGAVCRPLFDRHGESREKLAYLADSTSAPICILIPFNAWGALILGILEGQRVGNPMQVFLAAMPMNFYALAAVTLAGITAWSGWNLGSMKRARRKEPEADAADEVLPGDGEGEVPARAVNLVLPLTLMILTMPVALYVTGGGSLARGSGPTSVLLAVVAGNLAAWILVLAQRLAGWKTLLPVAWRGMRNLAPLTLILLLAMTLGEICRALGTGPYVASVLQDVAQPAVLLPATFLVGALISFATGTSWGTFAITIPIAVPAAQSLGLPLAPFLAACLSGGIFGDHASPISDTTIVSSMGSGTDVIAHVRTQLPYALLAGGTAILGFALVGLLEVVS